MADAEYKRLVSISCACGEPIAQPRTVGRKRKHCSDYCKDKAANRVLRRAGVREFVCAGCGKHFEAAIESTYCGSKCRAAASFVKQKELARAAHNKTVKPITCLGCEALFSPLYGYFTRATRCSVCVEATAATAASARRRARLRSAAVEVVDRLVVFARDKWRCALCGVRTIERPYMPNSAELDHIVPLALGGEHSYANTQCACRRCNGAKGAKAKGQTLLFG